MPKAKVAIDILQAARPAPAHTKATAGKPKRNASATAAKTIVAATRKPWAAARKKAAAAKRGTSGTGPRVTES